jgi:hypothetical protein
MRERFVHRVGDVGERVKQRAIEVEENSFKHKLQTSNNKSKTNYKQQIPNSKQITKRKKQILNRHQLSKLQSPKKSAG